jgi:hypothetical protein
MARRGISWQEYPLRVIRILLAAASDLFRTGVSARLGAGRTNLEKAVLISKHGGENGQEKTF